jgi:asparagine synthetase B (glutamine-hydrolysing)
MRRHAAEVAAFTIGFDVPGRDETTYARLAARHLGLRHHVEVVAERQVPDIIAAFGDAIDEPIGGGLALAMYVLGRVTRSEAAVVLGGDGGDGQFLGNERLVPPPMDAWLRGRLRPVLLDVLAPARIEAGGLFMPAAVSRLVDQHLANVGNHSIALRLLLMFELWRTRWLRRPGVDQ